MAEIRKHRPRSTGSIGDQVRANIGAGPRPVTPGDASAPTFDPFVDQEADQQSAASVSLHFGATELGTEGWFSLGADAMTAMVEASKTSKPQTSTDDTAADQ